MQMQAMQFIFFSSIYNTVPSLQVIYYTALVHLYQCIQSAISYDNLPFSISYTTFIVETLWDTRTTVRRVVSSFRDLRMVAS